ncbi:MAG: Eco57I restriction-modification methylase domain-containing protein, partial [Candidatus Hodarchaeota archaeon]
MQKFYKTYIELHSNLVKNLKNLTEQNAEFYALTILNRLIFLFFIQKKGFLKRQEKDYLESAWSCIENLKKNYFYDFLLPLWFKFLSRSKDRRAKNILSEEKVLFGEVPFIGGKLFNPINTEWLKETLNETKPVFTLPNRVFKEIFEFLGSFNWDLDFKSQIAPIEANDSIQNQIIDSEILGYVLERSITRTELGVFYTPNYITKMMVRDTVEGYILSMIHKASGERFGTIAELVATGTEEQLTIVKKVLKDVKILDNSCGSGVFLVASAEVLFHLNRLFRNSLPDLEIAIKIVEENLYGVDILEKATQTCQLRLWLFLARFMTATNIIAFSNLDFHLVTGNSLLGFGFKEPEVEFFEETRLVDANIQKLEGERQNTPHNFSLVEQRNLQNENIFAIDKKKGKFDLSYCQNIMKRAQQEQKRKICFTLDDIIQEKLLHWHLYFPECLENGGFDIVIGNPPWGSRRRGARLDRRIKSIFNVIYPEWGNNLYGAFWSRTLELLRPGGWTCYITPNTFISIKTFEKLRKRLLETTIHKMVLFGDGVFQDAQAMGTLTLLVENQPWKEKHQVLVVDAREVPSKIILGGEIPKKICFKVEQRVWQALRKNRFLHGISANVLHFFLRESKSPLLSPMFGRGRQGLATANNKRFLRDIDEVNPQKIGYTREAFITGRKKWAKFGMGRWIDPYRLTFKKVILWENNGKELKKQTLCKTRRAYLRNENYYFTPLGKGEGISYKGLGVNNLCAARLPRDCIFGHGLKTFFVLPQKQKYSSFILAFLNSSVAQFFKSRCINTGKNTEVA